MSRHLKEVEVVVIGRPATERSEDGWLRWTETTTSGLEFYAMRSSPRLMTDVERDAGFCQKVTGKTEDAVEALVGEQKRREGLLEKQLAILAGVR